MGGEAASEKLCDCLLECLKNADMNTDNNLKGERTLMFLYVYNGEAMQLCTCNIALMIHAKVR